MWVYIERREEKSRTRLDDKCVRLKCFEYVECKDKIIDFLVLYDEGGR